MDIRLAASRATNVAIKARGPDHARTVAAVGRREVLTPKLPAMRNASRAARRTIAAHAVNETITAAAARAENRVAADCIHDQAAGAVVVPKVSASVRRPTRRLTILGRRR